MPEEKLNLIQFAAREMAEPGARAPQVMWGKFFYPCLSCSFSNHFPEHLRGHSVTPDLAGLVDGPDDPALSDSARVCPCIDRRFDPNRDRHRSDVAAFSDQVRYDQCSSRT